MLVFKERGKPEFPGENVSEYKERTNNKLNPHMTPVPGIEIGAHWWGGGRRALSPLAAPPLLCIR